MRSMSSLCFAILLAASTSAHSQTLAEVRQLQEQGGAKFLAAAEAHAKANPKQVDGLVLLTRARLQAGKAEAAIESAQRAVALVPNHSQAQFWLGNAYGQRINQVGMLSKMTMAPKLRDAYEAAVRLDPDLLEAREYLIQFYLQAPSAMGGGRDKAVAQANEIAKRDAARGHLSKATIAMSDKKPEEALKHYQAAHAAKPDDARIRLAVGLNLQQMERWDEAYRHFQRWTEQDPKASAAWYQIGRTAALSGKFLNEGMAALQRYLTLPRANGEPENQHAFYRLGQVQARAGKKAEARTSFNAALKLDPKMKEAKAELAKL